MNTIPHTDVATILGAFVNHIYGQTAEGGLLIGSLRDPSRIPAAHSDAEAATLWRKLQTSVCIRPAECEWRLADVDADEEFAENVRDHSKRRFDW